jgi:MarR family transcriptional regulator, transcriptional regulator for hemolysin
MKGSAMPGASQKREIAFLISDVARLMRTYADQHAASLGMTRAQWAVLVRLERAEGLKQTELADMLDLQPITLTRLVDRLCENGLIERRPDPNDRRAKRLYLTPAARPLIERLHEFGEALMTEILAGIDDQTIGTMRMHLDHIKDNLRHLIQKKPDELVRYG